MNAPANHSLHGVGTAAREDEKAAIREHYETQAAAAMHGRLLVLLRDARAALGPEFFYLAGQIDAVLYPVRGEPALGSLPDPPDLVFENYGGDSFGWFRK